MRRSFSFRRSIPQGGIEPVSTVSTEQTSFVLVPVTWRGFVPMPLMRVSVSGTVQSFATLTPGNGATDTVSVTTAGLLPGDHTILFELVSNIRQTRVLASQSATLTITGAAAVVFHAASGASFASGQTSAVVTAPSGRSGKTGILVVSGTAGQVPATPGGWARLAPPFNDGTFSVEIYVRDLDGTTLDQPTVTGGAIRSWVLATTANGAANTVRLASQAATASGTSHNPVSVSSNYDGSCVLSVVASQFADRTWTKPGNMTSRFNEATVSRGLAVASHDQVSAGAFDPSAWTASSATAAALSTIIVESQTPPATRTEAAVAAYAALGFTAARTVDVTDSTELAAAFADLEDGDDIVLAAGTYDPIDLNGVGPATRARLRSADGATATFQSTTTASAMFLRRGSDNWIIGSPTGNIVLDGGGTSLSALGVGIRSGTYDDPATEGPCENLYFSNVEMRDSAQSGVKCGADSTNITWDELCEIHNTGQATTGFGEGLYLGSSSGTDVTSNIEYRGEIHATTAEGVDAKPGVSDVRLINALIYDVNLSSGATNNKAGVVNRSGGTLLMLRCRVWDVKHTGGLVADNEPAGVACADGLVDIEQTVIWDCGGPALWTYETGSITADHITSWNTNNQSSGSQGFAEDASSGTITVSNSVYQGSHNASVSSSAVAVAADFVGPLTGTADAGSGPGSGFIVAPGSLIPAGYGGVL